MGWTLPSSPTPTLPKSQSPCDGVSEQLPWSFTHPAAPGKVPAAWLSLLLPMGQLDPAPLEQLGCLPAHGVAPGRPQPGRTLPPRVSRQQ